MGKDYQGCLITPIRLSTAQFVRSACASVHCASFYSRALSLSLPILHCDVKTVRLHSANG